MENYMHDTCKDVFHRFAIWCVLSYERLSNRSSTAVSLVSTYVGDVLKPLQLVTVNDLMIFSNYIQDIIQDFYFHIYDLFTNKIFHKTKEITEVFNVTGLFMYTIVFIIIWSRERLNLKGYFLNQVVFKLCVDLDYSTDVAVFFVDVFFVDAKKVSKATDEKEGDCHNYLAIRQERIRKL